MNTYLGTQVLSEGGGCLGWRDVPSRSMPHKKKVEGARLTCLIRRAWSRPRSTLSCLSSCNLFIIDRAATNARWHRFIMNMMSSSAQAWGLAPMIWLLENRNMSTRSLMKPNYGVPWRLPKLHSRWGIRQYSVRGYTVEPRSNCLVFSL